MTSPAVTALTQAAQDTLANVVRRKFNAYFAFTPNDKCTRSVPIPNSPGVFTYPDNSVISDLTILWSIYSETYQIIRDSGERMSAFIARDPSLLNEIRVIINSGEYWETNGTPPSLEQIPLAEAAANHVDEICRTLRNGYAHFRWRYDDLNARDYWLAQGWGMISSPAGFNLAARPAKNYRAYIVDTPKWSAAGFWQMPDLRIIVTGFGDLRYCLHRFLNIILNGDRKDIFGNP
jgi:hypothetical protein